MAGTMWRWLLLAVLLGAAACSRALPAPAPTSRPAVGPLAPSPTSAPPSAGPTAAPPTSTATRVATPAALSPGAQGGRLPAVVARLSLPAEIANVLPDPAEERVYVNDTAGTLHVVDTRSYRLQTSLPAGSGPLVLDAPNHLLFVSRPGGEEVAVVDTAALTVTAVITGGYGVAVDSAGHRAFVGSGSQPFNEPPGGEVQVWDTRTFRRLGAIPFRGVPTYNPLRDEVYLCDYSAYVVDGKTLALTGELTPDVGAQPMKWCNGCLVVSTIAVEPAQDTVVVELAMLSAGHGPGDLPQARLFSARSLEPLSHTVTVLSNWDGRSAILPPDDGLIYESRRYLRYKDLNTAAVYRAGEAEPLDLRDGLRLDYYLPGSQVALTLLDPYILALDARTWQPLGRIPYQRIRAMDAIGRRLYAWEGARLTVLSFTGGQPLPDEPPEAWPDGRLFGPVKEIHLSPAFARDHTLFAVSRRPLDLPDDLLPPILRSTDGGASWAVLYGALSEFTRRGPSYSLAVSPAYEQDRTLFVAGRLGDALGLGVWRSVDGGDTWQPAWQGLRHLKVDRLAISPRYADDHTLLAYCSHSVSLFRSQDGGASWTLFASSSAGTALPAPEEILPFPEPPVRFKAGDLGPSIQRSTDGGRTWQTVLSRADSNESVEGIALSSRFEADRQVFALFADLLYRSADGGDSWQVADDEALVRYDYRRGFTALALGDAGDGTLALFLGDFSGAVLRVDPAQVRWEARPRPTPTPTPTATPPPTPTPVPPPPDPIADLTATAQSPGSPTCGDTAPLLRATYEHWKDRLGCRSGPPEAGRMIIQRFERGLMIWLKRGELPEFRVLVDPAEGGRWHALSDRWQEGEPDPVLQPPAGLRQPLGRFGSAWREMSLEAVIGWAVGGEQGYDGVWQSFWQPFRGGELLSGPDGQVYVLFFDDSKWASE